MEPLSPSDALGPQADLARNLLTGSIHEVHRNFSAAHEVSRSTSTAGFGTQWRDLLVRVVETFKVRGFSTHELKPGGQKLPIVNSSLIYVWRVPAGRDAVAQFASGPTRLSALSAPLPPFTLFDGGFDEFADATDAPESGAASTEELLAVAGEAESKTMPLILVLISSSPGNLRSIVWAIATLNGDQGEVELSGPEVIWTPESPGGPGVAEIESFDSGPPPVPPVEPNEERGTASNE